MKQKAKKAQQGVTIIEIVISLAIIAAVLMIYQAASNSILLIRNDREQEIALRIANYEMDSLRNGGYTALPASGSTFSNSQLSSLPSGAGTLTTSDFNANTKSVTVTVTWQEPSAQSAHTAALTSLITKVGGLP